MATPSSHLASSRHTATPKSALNVRKEIFTIGLLQVSLISLITVHSVPPWAAAFGFAMLIAYLSDRTHHRFLFTLIPICVAIAGFAILLTVHNNHHLEYAALFLVTMGTYSAMPVTVCWFNMVRDNQDLDLKLTYEMFLEPRRAPS